MHVHLRWPDGAAQRVYSPSLVMTDHLDEGASYAVEELLPRIRTALRAASERVRASYGFPCTRAAASLAAVEARAARYAADDRAVVVAFER